MFLCAAVRLLAKLLRTGKANKAKNSSATHISLAFKEEWKTYKYIWLALIAGVHI